MVVKQSAGIDTIYICQQCGKREKEFAIKSRIQKYCSDCGGYSIKSALVESLQYASGQFSPKSVDFDMSEAD